MLQVCVNGARESSAHPALSADPGRVAAQAADAVGAGAREIHLHPKDEHGRDSIAPADVDRWVEAFRRTCPGVALGVTTGEWARVASDGPREPASRLAAIAGWTQLPDYASVNWHEDGADDIAALLLSRGVAVEAGIWREAGAEAWSASPVRSRCLRVLVELPDLPAAHVRGTADALIVAVRAVEPAMPILLHGEESSTWPALDLAHELGFGTRIGLEDTLLLPDGTPAAGNADLVRAALRR